MTSYQSYPVPRRPSGLPMLFAGAALALAVWMMIDRGVLVQKPPRSEPREVAPRGGLMEIEETTTRIFRENAPSVVHITTETLAYSRMGGYEKQGGTGTGFLWDDRGTVVTNYHVVAALEQSQGGKLKVALGDNLYDGERISDSPPNDIAVIRIVGAPSGLRPITVGTSADLQVGQFVLAIGNPYGFDRSLSTGTISALNRGITTENAHMTGLIQTDAAINPGNSGGPLLDSSGRLIGMNTAIYSPSGSSAGIGFAVPVDVINDVVPALLDGSAGQRQLGVYLWDPIYLRNPALGFRSGLPIRSVAAGSGAANAGLEPFQVGNDGSIQRAGDLIVAVDGTPLRSDEDLRRLLRGRKRGEEAEIQVIRGYPRNPHVETVKVIL